MKTGTTIRSKGIFVLNYSAKPKKYMMLVVDNEIVREEKIIANMNNYFRNTTHLKLKPARIDFKANLEKYNRYLSKL